MFGRRVCLPLHAGGGCHRYREISCLSCSSGGGGDVVVAVLVVNSCSLVAAWLSVSAHTGRATRPVVVENRIIPVNQSLQSLFRICGAVAIHFHTPASTCAPARRVSSQVNQHIVCTLRQLLIIIHTGAYGKFP